MVLVPTQKWIDIHLPEGRSDVMRFTLVWRGKLPSTGNTSHPDDVARIRLDLHPQMEYLWDTHPSLSVLKEYGYRPHPDSEDHFMYGPNVTPRQLALSEPEHFVDLCPFLMVDKKAYKPLVRKSLDLVCELKILFLRQEDPGQLQLQGGDLDGRIKCLLDALRMPSSAEQLNSPPSIDRIHCLMESDSLVSALAVDTERLLFPPSTHPHEVCLVIEASLRVLKVHPWNYCLL